MSFVCRPIERDRLRRFGSQEASGALLVLGERGAGKSSLVQAVAAASPAIRVLQANPAEQSWRFAGLSAVLTVLAGEGGSRLGERLMRTSEPAWVVAARLPWDLHTLNLAVRTLIVDDADLLDPDSRRVLGYLAHRLGPLGLRLLFTVSSLDADSTYHGLPTLRLAPLGPASATALARALRPGLDGYIAHLVCQEGGGNPLAIREALEVLTAGQLRDGEPISAPLRFGPGTAERVTARLASLSDCARTFLPWLASARITPIDALERIAALRDDGDVTERSASALDELVGAGLICRRGTMVSVREQTVRSVVYWSMDPWTRLTCHAELANAVAPIDQRLALWHSSFTSAPPSLPALLEAGVHFIRRGEVDFGMEIVERGLFLEQPDGVVGGLLVRAGEGLLLAGHLVMSERMLARTSRTARGGDPAVDLLRLRLVFARRREVLTDLLDVGHERPGDARAVAVSRLLTVGAAFHAQLSQHAAAHELLERAERLCPDGPVGMLRLRAGAQALVTPDADVTLLEERSATEDLSGWDAEPLIFRARAATMGEDYELARALFDRLAAFTDLAPLFREVVRVARAENEVRAGNFHRAFAAVEELLGADDNGTVHPDSRALLVAWYWAEHGEFDRARESVGFVRRIAALAGPLAYAQSYAILGAAALEAGDVDEGLRLLRQLPHFDEAFPDPALLRYEANLVELLVTAGRTDEAADVLARFETRAAAHPSRWAGLVLPRCRALVLPETRALRAVDACIDAWPFATEHVYEFARTHLAAARLLRRRNQEAEARAHRRIAATALFDMGHAWFARGVLAAVDPLPSNADSAWDLLSERERMVVEQVLAGRRNKEIAEQLFVSLRTVEVRLTGIYRKLGVRSRAQLIARLTGTERSDTLGR